MSASVLFYLYAAVALAGAIVLVTARNLIHGVVGLFATLVAIGALFLVLGCEFLAAMQLFVYGGAITVLVLMGLMISGPVVEKEARPRRAVYWVAGIVSVLFFVAVATVLWTTNWHIAEPYPHDTASLAAILFSRYVLPFEIAGLSLTIALIGAIVIAREDDAGDPASEVEMPTATALPAESEGDAA